MRPRVTWACVIAWPLAVCCARSFSGSSRAAAESAVGHLHPLQGPDIHFVIPIEVPKAVGHPHLPILTHRGEIPSVRVSQDQLPLDRRAPGRLIRSQPVDSFPTAPTKTATRLPGRQNRVVRRSRHLATERATIHLGSHARIARDRRDTPSARSAWAACRIPTQKSSLPDARFTESRRK